MSDVQFWVSIVQILAGFSAAGALIFAGLTFKRLRRTEQIRLAEGILRDLNALDREAASGDDMSIKLWDQRYFNQLDWLCLLIRKKEIEADFLKEHFAPSIVYDYENIYLKHASEEEIKDPTKYEQFKKLYEELKRKDEKGKEKEGKEKEKKDKA